MKTKQEILTEVYGREITPSQEVLRAMDRYADQFSPPLSGVCQCKPEDKHGQTSVMCCNHCGMPDEEFWKPPLSYREGLEAFAKWFNTAQWQGGKDDRTEQKQLFIKQDFPGIVDLYFKQNSAALTPSKEEEPKVSSSTGLKYPTDKEMEVLDKALSKSLSKTPTLLSSGDAVAFAEWCSENMYGYDSGGNWFRDVPNWPSRKRIKSFELYSLFKSSSREQINRS